MRYKDINIFYKDKQQLDIAILLIMFSKHITRININTVKLLLIKTSLVESFLIVHNASIKI